MANPAYPVSDQTKGVAARRYAELDTQRAPFLERARLCSRYTIPTLIPPEGATGSSSFYTPFQSVGAEGVNSLASKLLLTLLSPGFFRMGLEQAMADTTAEQDDGAQTAIDKALAKIERIVNDDVDAGSDRVVVFEAFKHLIVGGNVLLFDSPDGMRCFHLSRYCVLRDPMGNPLEIVVKESVSPKTLSQEVLDAIGYTPPGTENGLTDKNDGTALDIYTRLVLKGKRWEIVQECNGATIPKSHGLYPVDKCPWLPLRLLRVDGEDYGRGYVEEYIGDVLSLEGLSQTIVEGTAALAKLLFLVNPNGTTRIEDIISAPNGAVRAGMEKDVSVLQAQHKAADLQVARQMMADIERRLSKAFILADSVQRDAERVTAEEIRLMAQELESRMGGVYSVLSQEFQLPFVRSKLAKLQKAKRLPSLPPDMIRPIIVTGMAALGRNQDRNKLVQLIGTVAQLLGPEAVGTNFNQLEVINRLASADNIDVKGLVRTPEEVQQTQQQQLMQQMAHRVGPNVVNAMAAANSGAAGQPPEQPQTQGA